MKSHSGFQPGNFLHALASYGLAATSSVLVLAHAAKREGTNRDILRSVDLGFSGDFPLADGKIWPAVRLMLI
jgi:uncharacterized protein YhjY with autotransporter beta-barrel domain